MPPQSVQHRPSRRAHRGSPRAAPSRHQERIRRWSSEPPPKNRPDCPRSHEAGPTPPRLPTRRSPGCHEARPAPASASDPPVTRVPRDRPDATAASDPPIPRVPRKLARPRLRRLTRRSPGTYEAGPTPCRLLTLGPRKACPAPHLPCDVLFFGALAQGPSAGSRRALRARMDDVSLRRQVDKALDHLVDSHARGVDMHGVLGSPQWTVRPAAVVRVPPVEVRGRAAPLCAVLP